MRPKSPPQKKIHPPPAPLASAFLCTRSAADGATYHFPPVEAKPGVGLETPRNAWCGWDLGDPGPSQPSALPRTLSRARKMTVTTVIAGQVVHIRTNVEQTPFGAGRDARSPPCHVAKSYALHRVQSGFPTARLPCWTCCERRMTAIRNTKRILDSGLISTTSRVSLSSAPPRHTPRALIYAVAMCLAC